MADNYANIIVRAYDQFTTTFTKLQGTLDKAATNVNKAAIEMRKFGREINHVGSELVILGGAVTAPMILAYKNSEQFSAGITDQIDRMKTAYNELSLSIGESLMPIMEKFITLLNSLREKWDGLGQRQRDHIIQTAFVGAGYLLLGGIALKSIAGLLVGLANLIMVIKSVGMAIVNVAMLFARNPILIAITLIVAAMWKWKVVADVVMGAIDIWITTIAISLRQMSTLFMAPFQLIIDFFERLASLVIGLAEKFPLLSAAQKKALDDMRKGIDQTRQWMEGTVTDSTKAIAADYAHIADVASGKNVVFANSFQNLKGWIEKTGTSIVKVKDNVVDLTKFFNGIDFSLGESNKPEDKTKQFFPGWEKGLKDAQIKLTNFFEMGKTAATEFVDNMDKTFTSFFSDAFSGQLKKASEYFKQFTIGIAQMFGKMIAQMTTQAIMFGNGSKGSGLAGILTSAIMGIGGAFAGGVSSTAVSAFGGGATSYTAPSSIPSNLSYFGHYHQGGIIKAHSGLAVGEVPIIAQSGEGILSRRGMANLAKLNSGNGQGNGGVTININPVIQAWDATDVYRNRRALTDAISKDIMNNGMMRKVIRQYGS